MTKEPASLVSDLFDSTTQALPVDMSAREVAIEFEHDDLISAPVIDQDGYLLGRITIDDVVDVIREEGEHMVLTAAGLDEEEDMFAPVLHSARRRWVWLGVNLITTLLAAVVLYAFQPTLDKLVALAVLFPVVMSMGGIAGTQTLTVMIRGMATGQVGPRNSMAILRKELAVGVLNGIVVFDCHRHDCISLVRKHGSGPGDGLCDHHKPGGRGSCRCIDSGDFKKNVN